MIIWDLGYAIIFWPDGWECWCYLPGQRREFATHFIAKGKYDWFNPYNKFFPNFTEEG
jgi:hypothetical protein